MVTLKMSDEVGKRAPSLRGAAYIYTRRGVTIAAKWPRKRGPAKTPEHREQTSWFRQARKLQKYLFAGDQNVARMAAAGTPLLPGDLLMMARAGRTFATTSDQTGTTYPERAMSDVSKSLDVITDQPGKMLVRGEDHWEAADGGGPGATWIWNTGKSYTQDDVASYNRAWKGNILEPRTPLAIFALSSFISLSAGEAYQAVVCELRGREVVSKIIRSPIFRPEASEFRATFFPMPVELAVSKRYFIGFGVPEGGLFDGVDVPMDVAGQMYLPARSSGPFVKMGGSLEEGDSFTANTSRSMLPLGLFATA